METKDKTATIECEVCEEEFTGLTEKQAERYKQMHNCKGKKDE